MQSVRLFLFQVVGGMVWCISVCSYDVDVDLLFQENSSIGQKMFVFTLYTVYTHLILQLHNSCVLAFLSTNYLP